MPQEALNAISEYNQKKNKDSRKADFTSSHMVYQETPYHNETKGGGA